MAVKIRLARRGRKKRAMYDVVIADARAPRDGRFIEKIGTYNPNTDPATINLDNDKAFDWVMKGAQPTDTVRAMLSYRGVMLRKHLQVGVNKGAITQEEADKKLADWSAAKAAKIAEKTEKLTKAKTAARNIKLEAEAKVSAARADALAAKNAEATTQEAAAKPEEATTESTETEEENQTVSEATETKEVEKPEEPTTEAVKGITTEKAPEVVPKEEKTDEAPAKKSAPETEQPAKEAPEEKTK